MPFLANEEIALKALLQGVTVTDVQSNARQVGVWYEMPEPEARKMSYPAITITFMDLKEATDRAHRGIVDPGYTPEGVMPAGGGSTLRSYEFPTPVDLDYVVTTHARNWSHDRQITGQLLGSRLPLRFGRLEVAQDNTVRRLDLLRWNRADALDGDNKRVFRKQFFIRVSAELFTQELLAVQHALSVSLTLKTQLPYETQFVVL